jgi:hypothetical protein
MKPVGRPAQVDINGEKITKSLLNVTIPSKLADFLRREEINRSQLFTRVVSDLFANQLCSKCFSRDITESPIGMHCKPCSRYDYKHGWYHLNRCEICDIQYKPGSNVPIATKPGSDADMIAEWGCQQCQK